MFFIDQSKAVPGRHAAELVRHLTGRAAEEERAKLVMIPRYDVRAAAGHGSVVHSEEQIGALAFRNDWLMRRGLKPQNLKLIDVVGDSMERVLSDGDLVLVDVSQTVVRSGKAYVIRMGEELLVKYLQRLPNGSLQAVSENKEAYPPFEISTAQLDDQIQIVGRVYTSTHNWP